MSGWHSCGLEAGHVAQDGKLRGSAQETILCHAKGTVLPACLVFVEEDMNPENDQHPVRGGTVESFEFSQERFRSMVQNSSDIVTLLARDGTVLFQSPSVETVLGYKPEHLIGQNAF